MDHQDRENKRQKVLDAFADLDPVSTADDMDTEPQMFPVTFEDMTTVKHKQCYACNNITSASLRENKYHANMIGLYTDNSTSICKDVIYRLVKDYYDQEIREQSQQEWPIDVIKEHFLCHTMYPTDEILTQINITSGLRRKLMDNIVQKNEAGDSVKFNINNAKLLISLNKELRILRKMKEEIPNMIGFDQTLNY